LRADKKAAALALIAEKKRQADLDKQIAALKARHAEVKAEIGKLSQWEGLSVREIPAVFLQANTDAEIQSNAKAKATMSEAKKKANVSFKFLTRSMTKIIETRKQMEDHITELLVA